MEALDFLLVLKALHAPRRGRPADLPEYFTPQQLHARWSEKVALGTMANWRALGRGPKFERFNGRVLYRSDVVVAWEKAQLAPLAPKGGRRG